MAIPLREEAEIVRGKNPFGYLMHESWVGAMRTINEYFANPAIGNIRTVTGQDSQGRFAVARVPVFTNTYVWMIWRRK